MNTNRRLVLWTLYDFSASIAVVVYLVYFSQWLVVENHVSDIWYNLIFVGASALLLITVPVASVMADKRNSRMSFLRITTLCQFSALFLTGCVASYLPHTPSVIALAVVFYFIAIYLHQFALVFYNALLPDISRGGSLGRTSGLGQLAKSFGTVAGILISLPFAHGSIRILGHPGRSQTFLPATVIAFLLTLPSLFQSEPPRGSKSATAYPHPDGYRDLARRLAQCPGLIPFLVTFFLFNDAILTIQDNLPIYMQRVLMIPDKSKTLLIALGLLAAAIGSIVGGKLSDRLGYKKVLTSILICWMILVPCMSLVRRVAIFALFSTSVGVVFGATWAISRALMARLAPRDQVSHSFGYYTIVERFSTFFGPLTWGLIVTLLNQLGTARYRVALGSMSVFIGISILTLKLVPTDSAQRPDPTLCELP